MCKIVIATKPRRRKESQKQQILNVEKIANGMCLEWRVNDVKVKREFLNVR